MDIVFLIAKVKFYTFAVHFLKSHLQNMKKTKYLTTLRTLSVIEMAKFSKFLKQRYNRELILLEIHKFFKTHYLTQDPPDKEEVHQKIFGENTVVDSRKLANGLSDLFLILKDYLIHQKLEGQTFEKEFLWLQVLEERKLEHKAILQKKKILKTVNTAKPSIWTAFFLFKIHHFHHFVNNRKNVLKELFHLEEAMHFFDEFISNMKLKMVTESINIESVYKVSQKRGIIEPFVEHDFWTSYPITPIHQFYQYLYAFKKRNSDESYFKFRDFFFKQVDDFQFAEKTMGVSHITNFAAHKIRTGETIYLKISFENYQFAINHHLLVHQNSIDKVIYENVVTIACRMAESQWAKKFIDDFKQYLPIRFRQESYSMAKALIALDEKRFAEAEEIIKQTYFKDLMQQLRAKSFLIKCAFELESPNCLEQCDNYDRFIRRHRKKMSDSIYYSALNFTKMLRVIDFSLLDKEVKLEQINNLKYLFMRGWLLSKVQKTAS